MIATGNASRICQVYDLNATGLTSTSKPPPAPLGSEVHIPALSQATILGYVLTSTGVLQPGGAKFADTAAYKAAPSNYTVISNPANMGAQRWILVVNQSGATIERGQLVKWDAAGVAANRFSVIVAATSESANVIMGAAQFDIADDKTAYILAEGYGRVLQGSATAAANTAFKPDTTTAGETLTVADPDEASCGFYIQDSGGDGDQTYAILACKR